MTFSVSLNCSIPNIFSQSEKWPLLLFYPSLNIYLRNDPRRWIKKQCLFKLEIMPSKTRFDGDFPCIILTSMCISFFFGLEEGANQLELLWDEELGLSLDVESNEKTLLILWDQWDLLYFSQLLEFGMLSWLFCGRLGNCHDYYSLLKSEMVDVYHRH